MSDDTEQRSSVPLPPKLDLRRSGVLKNSSAPVAPAPAAPVESAPAAHVAVSNVAESSTTMYIKMPDETPTVRVAAPRAPAPSIVVKGQAGPTIAIKRPAAQPSVAPALTLKPVVTAPASSAVAAPVDERKLASKRETSRIPLDLATPAGDMKTIRIKPVGGAAQPGVRVAPAEPAIATKPLDSKRKTSRISLESALAMEDRGGDRGAPKTIRLKKPGEAIGKVAPAFDTIRGGHSVGGDAAMSRTSPLEQEGEEEGEGPSPTRRRTIRVKRPMDKSGFKVVAGSAEAAGAGGAAAGAEGEVAISTKATGFDWTIMVVAVLTILLTLVVTFMLASQAWGPNSSLTELSSWTTGPDFGWTGKIPRAQ